MSKTRPSLDGASETQIIANRPNVQESDSPRTAPMEKSTANTGAPADCFMQNKANFRNAKMNENLFAAKAYENETTLRLEQNKPKQSQFRPPRTSQRSCKKEKNRSELLLINRMK